MSDSTIAIKDLHFSYDKDIPILKDISCNIEQGKITVIAGPNGCGKTTVLRLMGNVLKPQKGEVSFEGKNLSTIPMKEYAKLVAFVRQQNETVPVTVREYVALGRLPHSGSFSLFLNKNDNEIINKALNICEIEPLNEKLLTELSSGQKQLARIARSLAQEPKLLLLDEPTSNLDIKHQIDTLDMIASLVEKYSLTVVIVLHDLNLALQYANKVILMKDGVIVREGDPKNVIDKNVLEEIYETPISIIDHPQGDVFSIHPVSHLNHNKS